MASFTRMGVESKLLCLPCDNMHHKADTKYVLRYGNIPLVTIPWLSVHGLSVIVAVREHP